MEPNMETETMMKAVCMADGKERLTVDPGEGFRRNGKDFAAGVRFGIGDAAVVLSVADARLLHAILGRFLDGREA